MSKIKVKGFKVKQENNKFSQDTYVLGPLNIEDGNATGSVKTIGVNQNYTLGEYAFAEGFQTQALGANSHTEGSGTTTQVGGIAAHAEGNGSIASGENSHAQNLGTIAASDNQTVLGKYNIEDSNDDYAVIIGNGTDNNTRSNALMVQWNGDTNIAGDVAIGGDINIINGNLKLANKDVIQKNINSDNETKITIDTDYIKLNGIENTILQVNNETKSVLTVDKIHLNNGGTIQNFNALQHLFDGKKEGSLRTSNSQQEVTGEYSLGENAFAEGLNTRASGNNSHAEGYLQKTENQGVTINYYKDITPKSENFATGEIIPVYDDQNQVSYWRFNGQNAKYIKKLNYNYFCCPTYTLESALRYSNIITVSSFDLETEEITFEDNIDIESIAHIPLTIGPIIPLKTTDNLINSEIVRSSVTFSALGTGGITGYYYLSNPISNSSIEDVQIGDYVYDTTNNSVNAYIVNISSFMGASIITFSNDIFDATHLTRTFNIIRGNYSAERLETSGTNAHSEGKNTAAKGENSHSQNLGTVSETDNQTVIGTYNKIDTYDEYAFIIGNGSNDFNRSNALTVDWDGNVNVDGDINVNHNIDISGALTVNNQPLFKTEWHSTTKEPGEAEGDVDIAGNAQKALDIPLDNINIEGYTVAGVVAYSFSKTGTSGFASAQSVNSLFPSYADNVWRVYVRNNSSTEIQGVKCNLKFLYIKNGLIV